MIRALKQSQYKGYAQLIKFTIYKDVYYLSEKQINEIDGKTIKFDITVNKNYQKHEIQ